MVGGKLDGTLTSELARTIRNAVLWRWRSRTHGGNVTMQAGNGTLIGYRTTCEVDITTNGTGIVGVALDPNGGGAFTGSHGATLILDSATINGIIISGASAFNNTVKNISVVRTVQPTGTTSKGIGIVGTNTNLVADAVIDHTTSADSVNDYYLKGAAFGGTGHISFNAAYWGNTGLASPASGGCGFFIDSSDGTPRQFDTTFRRQFRANQRGRDGPHEASASRESNSATT